MRVVPHDDETLKKNYMDLIDLSDIFNHPIIEDDRGTYRWKENKLYNYLNNQSHVIHDREAMNRDPSYGSRIGRLVDFETEIGSYISQNDLAVYFANEKFSIEEYMKHKMDIGYSLCGFYELFSQAVVDGVIDKHTDTDKSWMEIAGEDSEVEDVYFNEREIYEH